MLHIVKNLDKLSLVIAYISDGDQLLLIENSVYAALPNHEFFSRISQLNSVSILATDVESRGLQKLVNKSINQVDFDGFVDLTVLCEKSVTW